MKKMVYRFVLLAVLTCLVGITQGCWDKEEPDQIGIVIMAAFDVDEDSGLKRVVVQVANPLGSGVEEGAGPDKEATWVEEATGHSAYDAVQNLELVSTRSLLWAHVEVLVLSEAVAQKGIRTVLDFFDRERQSRLITRPLVLQGDLKQLLEMEFPLETLGGDALSKHLLHVQEERSVVSEIDSMRIMLQRLSAPGQEMVLPLVKVIIEETGNKENEEEGEAVGEEKPEEGIDLPGTASFSGSAVFRGEKLAGFLDDRESTGYLWVKGQVQRATMVIKCPGCEDKAVTVEVFQTETELEPEKGDGKIKFKLQVRAESRIQDFACPELPQEKEFIAALNRRQAAVIRNEIEMSLDKARSLQTDIFGLGNLLYRKKPRVWEQLEEKWPYNFTKAEVNVEVEATIRRHGQITDPITIR